MPCYDSRDDPDALRKEFRHNSDVAQLLCEAIQLLQGHSWQPSPALLQWWKEHQERDSSKK